MTLGDILVIVGIAVAAVLAGLYFLNRWAAKKGAEQNEIIEKTKQAADIFVIDKKRDLYTNVNLPKAAAAQMPKLYKRIKMNFIMAKIGPKIVTLICEKRIYNFIQPKKAYKVELAGLYIAGVKGMKTADELKKAAKEKRAAKKAEAKAAKTGGRK
jgi:hypothetical protein